MNTTTATTKVSLREEQMKTYAFKVVMEKDKWPDEPDEKAVWRAYIPALEGRGAASWGYTEEEALENLQNAVDLLIEYMQKAGEVIPEEPRAEIQVSDVPLITAEHIEKVQTWPLKVES